MLSVAPVIPPCELFKITVNLINLEDLAGANFSAHEQKNADNIVHFQSLATW